MAFDVNKLPKLHNFLALYNSGMMNNLDDDMYKAYGGDDIIKSLKEFDPDAHWEYTAPGMGNEGSGGPSDKGSYRLQFDISKLPKPKGMDTYEARNTELTGGMYNPAMKYDDENYGSITHSKNVKKPKDPLWTKLAPMVPGMLAPWAAGYLATMGIGGAGLTGAATGSGLGAGASGALGKAISSGVKALPGIAGGVSQGNYTGLAKAGLSFVPGMQSVSQWLPVAQAAYGMTRGR